jgi:hypothetical protein
MAARLGIFLSWIFTSIALVLAALGAWWLLSRHSVASMTDDEFLLVSGIFVTGGIVWLLRRGVRFVLAGPKPNAQYISGFVERFADPSVPIRKPPAPPRRPGPWDARN